MMNPVRTTASWLGGRLFLFILILTALVAWDAYRDESILLSAQLKGLVPDKELIKRLETGRAQLEIRAGAAEERVNQRIRDATNQNAAAIDRRIAALQVEITAREAKRLSPIRRTVALMAGEGGIQEDLENEIEIQLLIAEKEALRSIKGELDALQSQLRGAKRDFEHKRARTLETWREYQSSTDELKRYLVKNQFWVKIPTSDEREHAAALRREVNERARQYNAAGRDFYKARERLHKARASRPGDVQRVQAAATAILEPLDQLILTKKAAVEAAAQQAEKIQRSFQNVFLNALGILIAVTLAPIGIKALWYWCVAPSIEKRPPIRLRPQVISAPDEASSQSPGSSAWERISAVSQEIDLKSGEELLVHPDFLQSSANRGRKNTQVLLDWRFPLTSIAAGMAVLTRIRTVTPESFVVSSKNDPFAEIGVLSLSEGTALVLQPRNLVGLVQRIDRPIRLQRRWIFSLSALITFQFRYLIFEGPGQLLVRGCRGVRLERAGSGRSIDQGSTMGFSANLDYSPKRSETFGAYLMGVNGLFNDSFSGGPGFCLYQEMPYAGKRSGLTGRGLEGLTDGLLKVVGI